MNANLTWRADTETYVARLGGKKVAIGDAYSQWVLGHGRAFDLSEQLPKEVPTDFDYVLYSPRLLNPGVPELPEDSSIAPDEAQDASEDMLGDMMADSAAMSTDAVEAAAVKTRGLLAPMPLRTRSVPGGGQEPVKASYTLPDGLDVEKLVITGVIDDGVNIFHDRFSSAAESQVDFAWVQDGPWATGSAVPFGCEVTGPQIAAAVATGKTDQVLMQEYGLTDPPGAYSRTAGLRMTGSHGTHVTDLAAGGAEREHRILTVQLPELVTQDTSGASLLCAVQAAAAYIYDRAFLMSRKAKVPIPVVLNLSYGLAGGARSGQNFVERALRALALRYRLRTARFLDSWSAAQGTFGAPSSSDGSVAQAAGPKQVLGAPTPRLISAGNSALMQRHAAALDDPQQLDVALRLQPADRTSSYLELWAPAEATKISLTVTPPGGTAYEISFDGLNAAKPKDPPAQLLVPAGADAKPIARVSIDTPHPEGTGGLFWRVLLALAPTAGVPGGREAAPHGAWKLSFTANQGASNCRLHAWVQRDSVLPGYPTGARQAYLEDPVYDASRFDAIGDVAVADPIPRQGVITRNGTISGMATNAPLVDLRMGGERLTEAEVLSKAAAAVGSPEPEDAMLDCVAVGGNRWRSGYAAPYTGADLLRKEAGDPVQAPPVMAVSETSRILSGVLAAATNSGSVSSRNGTSVSTPLAARLVADKLATLSPLERRDFDAKAYLGTLGVGPPRPDDTHPEMQTEPYIRSERLRAGGKLLPVPESAEAGVRRQAEPPAAPIV